MAPRPDAVRCRGHREDRPEGRADTGRPADRDSRAQQERATKRTRVAKSPAAELWLPAQEGGHTEPNDRQARDRPQDRYRQKKRETDQTERHPERHEHADEAKQEPDRPLATAGIDRDRSGDAGLSARAADVCHEHRQDRQDARRNARNQAPEERHSERHVISLDGAPVTNA